MECNWQLVWACSLWTGCVWCCHSRSRPPTLIDSTIVVQLTMLLWLHIVMQLYTSSLAIKTAKQVLKCQQLFRQISNLTHLTPCHSLMTDLCKNISIWVDNLILLLKKNSNISSLTTWKWDKKCTFMFQLIQCKMWGGGVDFLS